MDLETARLKTTTPCGSQRMAWLECALRILRSDLAAAFPACGSWLK